MSQSKGFLETIFGPFTSNGPIAGCDEGFVLTASTDAKTKDTTYKCERPPNPPGVGWERVSATSFRIPNELEMYMPIAPQQCPGDSLLSRGQCVRPCGPGMELNLLSGPSVPNKCRRIIPSYFFDTYKFLRFDRKGVLVPEDIASLVNVPDNDTTPFNILQDTGDVLYFVTKTNADMPNGPLDTTYFTSISPTPVSDAEATTIFGTNLRNSILKAYGLTSLDGHLWSVTKVTGPVSVSEPAGVNVDDPNYPITDATGRRVMKTCPNGYDETQMPNGSVKCVRNVKEYQCPTGYTLDKTKTLCVVEGDTKPHDPRRRMNLLGRVVFVVVIAGAALLIARLILNRQQRREQEELDRNA